MIDVKIVILEGILEIILRISFRSKIFGYMNSIVVIIDPSKSWLKKKIGLLRKCVPGSYAVEVQDEF